MRTLLTSLLLITLAPAAARATEMEEIPTPPAPSDKAAPNTGAPPTVAVPPADPQAEWDHHFIGFEDWVAYNVHSGAIVNAWSKPVEGKYRKPLAYDDFYEKVGRADLAGRYRTRRSVKIGLGVAGGVAIVGGFVAIIAQFMSNSDAWDTCFNANFHLGGNAAGCSDTAGNGGYVAGGLLLGVGFAGVLAAIVTPLQPAQPYEARELADQYNKKLRDQLGLDRAPAPKTAPSDATTVTLVPSVDSKGAGLRLVARF